MVRLLNQIILCIAVLLIPFITSAQQKIIHQLELRDKMFFKEINQLQIDKIWRLKLTVVYDEPKKFDEELWTQLTIEIKDTAALLKNRVLRFTSNQSGMGYEFSQWTAWDTKKDSTAISGYVQLIRNTKEAIDLNLNLIITNLKTGDQFIYKGERKFYKKIDDSFFERLKRINDK